MIFILDFWESRVKSFGIILIFKYEDVLLNYDINLKKQNRTKHTTTDFKEQENGLHVWLFLCLLFYFEFLEFCLFCICQGAHWNFSMRIQNLNFCYVSRSVVCYTFLLTLYIWFSALGGILQRNCGLFYFITYLPELTSMLTISFSF